MRRAVRAALVGLLLVGLFTLGALFAPVVAQSPTPPAATAAPTPTLTDAELLGVPQVDGFFAFVQRRGVWVGALVLGVVVAGWLLRRYGLRWLDKRDQQGEQQAQVREAQRGTEQQEQAGLAAYLTWLQEECGALPQKPLDEDDEQMLLEKVYVPLRVVEREQIARFVDFRVGRFAAAEEQQARKQALTGLDQSHGVFRLLSDRDCLPPIVARPSRADSQDEEPLLTTRLLLVGDAGSGKTTTLHFGALMLARDCLEARSVNARTELDLHTQERLLPVYIKLTLLTRYLREKYRADRSRLIGCSPELIYEWLDQHTTSQHDKIPAGLITQHVKGGKCLILFDGLDETGDTAQRDFAKELIANLVQACPNNRYIVASRPCAGVALGLVGFVERHLSPLNEDEMRRLLDQWFREVGSSTRRRARRNINQEFDELWGRLQESARLFDMATNPLLLTSMAILVHGGDSLPTERAKIYNRLVSLTIVRWRDAELRRGLPPDDESSAAHIYPEESDDDVRLRLQVLAAEMLKREQREFVLAEIQEHLEPIYSANRAWGSERCRNYIRTLMESLALHSGLMQERDERYSFIHFTLQEYLAARYYDEEDDIAGLLQWRAEPRWKETILLAVGHWATSGHRKRAEQALTKLLDSGESHSLLLAAEALDEANAGQKVELGAPLTRCTTALRACAFDPTSHHDAVLRNRAATLLDRLGADDDRPGLDLTRADYWAERIDAGVFSMGDDNGASDERPQFDCTIRQPYALARFPVTNRQYLLFVEGLAGRGSDEACAAAQQVLEKHPQRSAEDFHPRYWSGARYRAGEGNHPVVGVDWHAASAFAAWVDIWLHAAQFVKPQERILLPSEAEWERAAAYPLVLPGGDTRAGRREYPWGAWSEVVRANSDESGISDTSVVGIFPHGAADCGAEELAGNVWEWTRSAYRPYPYDASVECAMGEGDSEKWLTVRGGGWGTHPFHLRASNRNYNPPDDHYDELGFRLVRHSQV